jgi:hypothetical protein
MIIYLLAIILVHGLIGSYIGEESKLLIGGKLYKKI